MRKQFLLVIILPVTIIGRLSATSVWTQISDYPATPRSASCAYGVGTAGIVIGGYDTASFQRDVWALLPASDFWVKLNKIGDYIGGGLERSDAVAIPLDSGTALVGTGNYNGYFRPDCWIHNSYFDTWTQVPDLTSGGRRGAVGFSLGGKAFITTGQDAGGLLSDTWAYDPASNSWSQKAAFPGTPRKDAVAFVIDTMAYVGTGNDGWERSDFYSYDAYSNTWQSIAPFGGTARSGAVSFSIYGRGYVCTGYDSTLQYVKDCWAYDPQSDVWTQSADFGGTGRSQAVAFVVDHKAFVGLGYDGYFTSDFWCFDPAVGLDEKQGYHALRAYPNPATEACTVSLNNTAPALLRLLDMKGNVVMERRLPAGVDRKEKLLFNDLSQGEYLLSVTGNGFALNRKIVHLAGH